MNIFKTIWQKIRGFFVKRSPSIEQIVSEEEMVLSEAVNVEDIYLKIQDSINDKEKKILIKQIARQETAKKIIEFVENETSQNYRKKKNRKKLYELHELRNELQKLEEQKAILKIKALKIKAINYPDTSSLDNRLDKLFYLLSKNKIDNKVELTDFTNSIFDKDFRQLEKLFLEKSTLKRHGIREREKKKQREIYENNIKKELNNLDSLLGQNKLDEAKLLINELTKSIKPDFKKGIERLSKATTKLKEKELEFFRKRQAELLRQQEAEAEKIRIEQERILEQNRIAREQAEAKRKIEEIKKLEKEKKLKELLNKKSNWRDFQKVLQANNIKILYHFTDHSNLRSIKENGGLYSWYYCDKNNIVIPMTGNSSLGRSLDVEYGLEDFVRLSFIEDHPMKHVAMNEGRITRPILLKVSIEVCYFENTRFSDMNAADQRHKNSDNVDFLESLRFDLFKRSYFDLNPIEKKQHQAEILVKTWIPAEYITNLNEIVR